MNVGQLFRSDVVTVSPDDSISTASRARALAELQNSSYPDIRKLDCTFAAGVLTVRGRLPSFYLKQVVWSLVGRLPEIDELADCIEVRVPVGAC